jgi:hypothetical protein
MKILVYNYQNQYALSRKQIEAVKSVLPNEYFEPIREFHLTHTKRGAEIFEYNEADKTAHFAYPITEKTPGSTSDAIEELLVGLARIKASTRWQYPLKEREKLSYVGFVKSWKEKCLEAVTTKKP